MFTNLKKKAVNCIRKQLFIFFFSVAFSHPSTALTESLDLTDLSIEELMDVKVTSVSKKSQLLSESPAAVFVITNEDLHRSGVSNIPDALRMVPGLNVARIDSNKWAVSSRGPGTRFFSKLLVMIDGRSIYSPTFSGVYWELQDLMLEDVDRIEVIRGPGATMWGANAVNGVINIISKSASETKGGLISLGGGTYEKAFASARYGNTIGKNSHGRIYAKGFERDSFHYPNGSDAGDDWGMRQGGFRFDSDWSASDNVTLQGDIYQGDIGQTLVLPSFNEPYTTTVKDTAEVNGGNLLARWQHIFSSASELTFQAYFDRTEREEAYIGEERETIDLDFQHHLAAVNRHDINWGVRYRRTQDDFDINEIVQYDPVSRNDDLLSAFVQDEIVLVPQKLWLTLGAKVEHNDYTGEEIQPGARLFWSVTADHKLWTSVARAVRTPSRFETDGRAIHAVYPPTENSSLLVPILYGNDDARSEKLMAYEIGYRFVPDYPLSIDVAAFFNEYEQLGSIKVGTPEVEGSFIELPILFCKDYSDKSHGAELSVAWQIQKWLNLNLAYTYLESDQEEGLRIGKAPRHQLSIRSAIDLSKKFDMDFWFRYVDDATMLFPSSSERFAQIDSYFTMDIRLAWQISPSVELSLVGQNLLNKSHIEAYEELYTMPTEVPRSLYSQISWNF